MTREEYLKMFRDNEDMKNLLSKAPDATEKRMIKAYAEDFLLKFYDSVLDPLSKAIEKDPDALNKALTKIEEDLIISGSTTDS
jgi:hypothetical protein